MASQAALPCPSRCAIALGLTAMDQFHPPWIGLHPPWIGLRPPWIGLRPPWIGLRPPRIGSILHGLGSVLHGLGFILHGLGSILYGSGSITPVVIDGNLQSGHAPRCSDVSYHPDSGFLLKDS